MRTNVQGVKRYFGTIWSFCALLTGVFAVVLSLIDEPTPDWAVIVTAILWGGAGGGIGFVHGITTFVAREHDERDQVGESE